MKSIVVHIQDDPGLSARLQTALDLARSFGGHLSCLQTAGIEIMMPSGYEAVAVPTILPMLRELAEELKDKLSARLEQEDVPWDWQTEFGSPASPLSRRAALADLVVMGTGDKDSAGKSSSRIVGQVVVHSRAPLLVVPENQHGFDTGRPVLVGWNGSPESANALRAAIPLLRRAEQVFLARVTGGKRSEDGGFQDTEGAQYLSRHGIECEMVELPDRDGAGVARLLSDAALARNCGLLVMGGYGHSRFAEWLLGGVTRDMLTELRLPVLLAH